MKKVMLLWISLISVNSAIAIPQVYNCTLNHFTANQNVEYRFQFNPSINEGYQVFLFSEVELRFYMSQIKNLSISIRSKSNPNSYASALGFDFPHRMRISHFDDIEPIPFGAVVDCSI
jgi:hypothetical protein